MKNKIANIVLALVLITLLALPLAQPGAAADLECWIVSIDTFDENGELISEVEEICCLYRGEQYCMEVKKAPSEDDGLP